MSPEAHNNPDQSHPEGFSDLNEIDLFATKSDLTRIPEDVRDWITNTLVPLVEQCRESGNWMPVSAPIWKGDKHFNRVTYAATKKKGAWYEMLQTFASVSSDEIGVIKKQVRANATANRSYQPRKCSEQELQEWFTHTVIPAVELARKSGEWSALMTKHWKKNPFFNSFCYFREEGSVTWQNALLKRGAITSTENELISQSRKNVQSQNAKLTSEQISLREEQFKALLLDPLTEARRTGNWALLTWDSLGSQSAIVKVGVSLTQISELKERGVRCWYSALQHYGNLDQDEIKAIKEVVAEQKKEKISNLSKRYSQDELDKWIEKTVKPVVEEARKFGKWELVLRKQWEKAPEQVTLCNLYGSHSTDWHSVLLQYSLVNAKELSFLREATRSEKARSISEKRQNFSKAELTAWFNTEILTRIVAAREGGDWGELMLAAWRGDPHFSTINQVFGKANNDWYGVLVALGKITTEEETLIRQQGELARVRKRETPQPHGYVYERSSKAKRQIAVVERLVLGDTPRQETNFRTVIDSIKESGSFHVSAQTISISNKTRAVLEVNSSGLLREHLSPADQLRLLFSRMKGESDWSYLATRYQDILPSLSSFLSTRSALLYINSLAREGTIEFPRSALSVGSGTGDLYDACQELEPLLNQDGSNRPVVTDLDFSLEMLRLSKNPDKIHCNALSIPLDDSSYGMVECSSLYRMGTDVNIEVILRELHRVIQPNGLLWLKADGVLFSDNFARSLERLGFELVAPTNCTLQLFADVIEGLDPKLRQRTQAALRNTHFIFATKTEREAQEVDADDLTFMRKRTVSEDVEEVQNLLKGLLRSATDNEYIINARIFVETMSVLAPETFNHKGALAVGLLHKYLSVLFNDSEIGTLPKKRDVENLHAKLRQHQQLINSNLSEAEGHDDEPDSIVLYLTEMKRAVDHLEYLAASNQ